MKSILFENKIKLGLILIAVIIVLWTLWADELIRYDSLDSYISLHTNLNTSSKIIASDNNYALCVLIKNSNIYSYKILEKTKHGKWKQLEDGWDYKFGLYYIWGKNKFYSCTIYTFYIKGSNILILNLQQIDDTSIIKEQYNSDINFIKIKNISDLNNSIYNTNEIITENTKTYTFTAIVKDFNYEEYELYIDDYSYPYNSWTNLLNNDLK